MMRPLGRLLKAPSSILRQRTVRLRLTLLYSALFLASGAGLLGITYALVAHQLGGPLTTQPHVGANPLQLPGGGVVRAPAGNSFQAQQAADLHQFLIWSLVALGIMAVVSIALGWLVAGGVLRPVRTMTATARQISEDNLHERLALQGPYDEFKDLGDTIDGLLARLEAAFDSQKRFVANASHELRTPLTLGRTMLQVALANSALTLESLRSTCGEVLEAGREQEQLIEALLTLARSQRGLDHRESFDLALATRDVLRSHEEDVTARGLTVNAALSEACVSGDARLAELLVSNLVENALRHNVPNGRVDVMVGTRAAQATLRVTNTGPRVPDDQITRLLQPFQRLDVERGAEHEGLGVGLSIVAAIAGAHGATITTHPGLEGGLDVEVDFPIAVARSSRRSVPTTTFSSGGDAVAQTAAEAPDAVSRKPTHNIERRSTAAPRGRRR